jgi:hypothetical protein
LQKAKANAPVGLFEHVADTLNQWMAHANWQADRSQQFWAETVTSAQTALTTALGKQQIADEAVEKLKTLKPLA